MKLVLISFISQSELRTHLIAYGDALFYLQTFIYKSNVGRSNHIINTFYRIEVINSIVI